MTLLDSFVFCVLAFESFCVGSGLVSPLFYPLTTILFAMLLYIPSPSFSTSCLDTFSFLLEA